MEVDDLRIVEAVAKSGSMNRAAAELNMVQSNVTSRIRLLEEELGVQLFIRHSRGVTPSDAGLRLLSYSEQISSLFRAAVEAVEKMVFRKEASASGRQRTVSDRGFPSSLAGTQRSTRASSCPPSRVRQRPYLSRSSRANSTVLFSQGLSTRTSWTSSS